jgi:hypothetical protein
MDLRGNDNVDVEAARAAGFGNSGAVVEVGTRHPETRAGFVVVAVVSTSSTICPPVPMGHERYEREMSLVVLP